MLKVFLKSTFNPKCVPGPEQPEESELVWERNQLCHSWSLWRTRLPHLPQPHFQPLQLQLSYGLVSCHRHHREDIYLHHHHHHHRVLIYLHHHHHVIMWPISMFATECFTWLDMCFIPLTDIVALHHHHCHCHHCHHYICCYHHLCTKFTSLQVS